MIVWQRELNLRERTLATRLLNRLKKHLEAVYPEVKQREAVIYFKKNNMQKMPENAKPGANNGLLQNRSGTSLLFAIQLDEISE